MDATSPGFDDDWQAFADSALGGALLSQHWQGGPVNCGNCCYAKLRAMPGELGCEPGHACMQDVYARRIDRFFRWHPTRGDEQLTHAYLEVRAIAARHASVFRLPTLIDDPDETVRLEMPALLRMAHDRAPEVRRIVAERLPAPLLSGLASDADWRVRWEVAQRADAATLNTLRDDEDEKVRDTVRARLAREVTRIGVVHG